MPKNTKKKKNSKNKRHAVKSIRPLITKDSEQEYARVTKMLGNRYVECECFDNKVRLGHIRKSMKRGKENRINIDDVVLISLREFQDNKADIIHLYNNDEVKKLIKMYEIPDEQIEGETINDFFTFDKVSSDNENNKESIDVENI